MNIEDILKMGKFEVMEITPAKAREMLKGNNSNRKLSKANVTGIVNAIKRGEWKFNGSPIIIGISGRVLDGQHRLEAINEAEKSVCSLVVSEIPDDVFDTLDIGRKRNNSDTLRIRGEANANVLAATAKLLHSYYIKSGVKFAMGGHSSLTPIQTENVITAHPSIRESVAYAVHNNKDIRSMLTVSLSAAIHFILTQVSSDIGLSFIEKMRTGANLEIGNPILALRRSLVQCQTKQPRFRAHLVFKAWNALVSGREVRMLRITDTERLPILLIPQCHTGVLEFANLSQGG